jgi:hypothetical protein
MGDYASEIRREELIEKSESKCTCRCVSGTVHEETCNLYDHKNPNCEWCKDGKIKMSCPKCQPLRFQKERRESKEQTVDKVISILEDRYMMSPALTGSNGTAYVFSLVELLVECGLLQNSVLPKE